MFLFPLGDIYFMGFNCIAYPSWLSSPHLLFCCVEGADNWILSAVQLDLQHQPTPQSSIPLPQQSAIPNQLSHSTMHTNNPYNIQPKLYASTSPAGLPRYQLSDSVSHATNLLQQSWNPFKRINHNTMSSLMMPNPWMYSSSPPYSSLMSHPGQLLTSNHYGFNRTNRRQPLGWSPTVITSGINSGGASVSGEQFDSFPASCSHTCTAMLPLVPFLLLQYNYTKLSVLIN